MTPAADLTVEQLGFVPPRVAKEAVEALRAAVLSNYPPSERWILSIRILARSIEDLGYKLVVTGLEA